MSLINDALKKAQQKRAEDAAQTPPPPPHPVKDTISQPPPAEAKAKIPAPPPPANRPQLPIPPPPAPGTRRPPPIVNYSIPQVDPAELPATPNNARPRISSSIRYTSVDEDESEPRSTSVQKTFWIALACIAAIAVIVRIVVTLGRDDPTATRPKAEQVAPPQIAVALPTPSLPPLIAPARPAAPETPEVVPAPAPQETVPAPAANEPAPAVSFPTKPAATAKPAPTPVPAAKPTPPVVSLPPPAPTAPSTPEAAPAQPQPAPAVLPSIYAPRAPTPVNNATRIQNFIDRLRVTGVRITDHGSKVILNDRLFNAGEIVDGGLELKLVKIEPGMITFTDASGKKYVKLYQ